MSPFRDLELKFNVRQKRARGYDVDGVFDLEQFVGQVSRQLGSFLSRLTRFAGDLVDGLQVVHRRLDHFLPLSHEGVVQTRVGFGQFEMQRGFVFAFAGHRRLFFGRRRIATIVGES